MKQALQEQLFEEFPLLFKQRHLPKEESAMSWGIDCPDEWFEIIYKACELIQNYCNYDEVEQIEFIQVKEKFGHLRIYYKGFDPYINGVIDMANKMVFKGFKFRQLQNEPS